MSVLTLNCRGVGGDTTVRELRRLARRERPDFLCIVETHVSKERVEALPTALGYDRCYALKSTGRSGGLGVFWNDDFRVSLICFSQYHIDLKVKPRDEEEWRLTSIYGEAKRSERKKTWDLLKYIRCENDLPWLVIGDFNEVLHHHEHVGVGERDETQMLGFRDAVDVALGFGREGGVRPRAALMCPASPLSSSLYRWNT